MSNFDMEKKTQAKTERKEFIKIARELGLKDLNKLPDEHRRALLRAKLGSAIAPMKFLMGRTPLGMVARLRMVGAAALGAAEGGSTITAGEELAYQAANQLLRANAIRITNNERFKERVDEAKKAGEQAPRRSFIDRAIEQVVPGFIYGESNFEGSDKFGRPK